MMESKPRLCFEDRNDLHAYTLWSRQAQSSPGGADLSVTAPAEGCLQLRIVMVPKKTGNTIELALDILPPEGLLATVERLGMREG